MFDINTVNVNSLFTDNSGASKLAQYNNPFARDGKKASKNKIKKKSRFIRHFKKK